MIIYKIIKFKAGDWFESGSSTLDTALNQWSSWEGSGRMTQELGASASIWEIWNETSGSWLWPGVAI